jgi:NAD(P)-dependent dehydrogenase (short-subunit alcohol dehydrogenase family)
MQSVSIMTGGSRGIGAATAQLAAQRGYSVCVATSTIGFATEVATDGKRVHVGGPGIIDTDIHATGGKPQRGVPHVSTTAKAHPATVDGRPASAECRVTAVVLPLLDTPARLHDVFACAVGGEAP